MVLFKIHKITHTQNDIITFNKPLLNGTSVLAMYYDRKSYTSSFQLDTIGDELKTFGAITPGIGYSNGTYTNVPLKNNLGSGSGATADITVSGNKVTNVVLNQAGNGYTEDDVLGLSDVGEQLTNNYVPSTATYTPANGDLELTIGAHTLTTNDTVELPITPNIQLFLWWWWNCSISTSYRSYW